MHDIFKHNDEGYWHPISGFPTLFFDQMILGGPQELNKGLTLEVPDAPAHINAIIGVRPLELFHRGAHNVTTGRVTLHGGFGSINGLLTLIEVINFGVMLHQILEGEAAISACHINGPGELPALDAL